MKLRESPSADLGPDPDFSGRRGGALLPAERRQRIFEIILSRHTVSVTELAERFEVSGMTIRRDLQLLEEQGLVESVHGGAKSSTQNPFELSYAQRELIESDAKRAIGQLAATLIRDGETAALDGSTTTLHVARHLFGRQRMTVVTNGIKAASELGHRPGIEVIVTGGELHQTASLVGPFARATLERLRVDWTVLSVTGVTTALDLMGPSEYDAETKATMIDIARRVMFVADVTKFGRDSYIRVATMDRVSDVITDDRIAPEWVERIEAAGVSVHIASLGSVS